MTMMIPCKLHDVIIMAKEEIERQNVKLQNLFKHQTPCSTTMLFLIIIFTGSECKCKQICLYSCRTAQQ